MALLTDHLQVHRKKEMIKLHCREMIFTVEVNKSDQVLIKYVCQSSRERVVNEEIEREER